MTGADPGRVGPREGSTVFTRVLVAPKFQTHPNENLDFLVWGLKLKSHRYKTHPKCWCSIAGQKVASFSRVDMVSREAVLREGGGGRGLLQTRQIQEGQIQKRGGEGTEMKWIQGRLDPVGRTVFDIGWGGGERVEPLRLGSPLIKLRSSCSETRDTMYRSSALPRFSHRRVGQCSMYTLRLAAGEVAPLRPWVGGGAKSTVQAHSASRHA